MACKLVTKYDVKTPIVTELTEVTVLCKNIDLGAFVAFCEHFNRSVLGKFVGQQLCTGERSGTFLNSGLWESQDVFWFSALFCSIL